MNRNRSSPTAPPPGVPCARADEPPQPSAIGIAWECSPRFAVANAGMSRPGSRAPRAQPSVPCARGDEPSALRRRGCHPPCSVLVTSGYTSPEVGGHKLADRRSERGQKRHAPALGVDRVEDDLRDVGEDRPIALSLLGFRPPRPRGGRQNFVLLSKERESLPAAGRQVGASDASRDRSDAAPGIRLLPDQ